MASDSDFDVGEIRVSEMVEGLAAILTAPVFLPLTAAINQPAVRSAIKEGIAFSERCKEAVAEAGEQIEDLLAEAQAEMDTPSQSPSPHSADVSTRRRSHVSEGRSQLAGELMNTTSEVNAQVGWLTNGLVDLRMLVPIGLSGLALRQLVVKGLQFDDIPWYTLAWYSFDTFLKLHPSTAESQPQLPAAESPQTNDARSDA
ncbi:MAG: DUF5132 domain-containing protein [Elainellaceae cyanobacterium]